MRLNFLKVLSRLTIFIIIMVIFIKIIHEGVIISVKLIITIDPWRRLLKRLFEGFVKCSQGKIVVKGDNRIEFAWNFYGNVLNWFAFIVKKFAVQLVHPMMYLSSKKVLELDTSFLWEINASITWRCSLHF